MKSFLFLRLAQLRSFWIARRLAAKTAFWSRSKIFRTSRELKNRLGDFQSLLGIASVIKSPLAFAILVAVALQLVDPHLRPYFFKLRLHVTEFFKLKLVVPDDTDYVPFLATIGSIGGVFIGLYYAAIATVGSAIYARVPSNVRDLLAQERFGNVYMRLLSFLTFLCLILISFRMVGISRSYTAVPFVTLSAGIGIFAFVKLGQRVFNLFDPTVLSDRKSVV